MSPIGDEDDGYSRAYLRKRFTSIIKMYEKIGDAALTSAIAKWHQLQVQDKQEVERLTARNDDLEKQLADVLVDIITLESENANKHHVDELLFKANERIAELERGFCSHKSEQECTHFTEGEQQ